MFKWLTKKLRKFAVSRELSSNNGGSNRTNAPGLVSAELWRKRGNAFIGDNNFLDAELCYRSGIYADPSDAICYSNLGFVLAQTQRLVEAESILSQAVELNPADFDAYYLLGNLARNRGDALHAIVCFRSALSVNPNLYVCRRDLCILHIQIGQPDEARMVFSQTPAGEEQMAEDYVLKGNLHLATCEYEDAVACFQKASDAMPTDCSILINLGAAQIGLRNVTKAVETYNAALLLEPNNVIAHSNIAEAFKLNGHVDLAINSYRKAISINPQHLFAQQNLLYVLSYCSECSATQYKIEAQEYRAKVLSNARPYTSWRCPALSQGFRRLRVGFVSGDLRMHPVGYFLVNMLSQIDRKSFTCVAYSNSVKEDSHSVRLKTLFSEWNVVANISDADLAKKIHADNIDILVDLSGYTAHNRLPVFVWRSAPVQVSWLGYWASTGIAEIDYILVDDVSVNQSETGAYSEEPWFLPDTRLCFSIPNTDGSLVVTELPALKKGYTTFASFQALSKISEPTLRAWSKILAKLPQSRLRMQSLPLTHETAVIDWRNRLASAKIDLDRVDMFGGTSREQYLAAYGEVDMVLDTFPFPGGTTTVEALWMGVPTVTLSGDTLLSRQGKSILLCSGLKDWVATNEHEYVQIAVTRANNLPGLMQLRANLRETVLKSPLFNGVEFAKNIERAFQGMVEEKSDRFEC
jgi:protein O-GlcNAc transferase